MEIGILNFIPSCIILLFLTKNGFSRYSILSEKSEIPGEKLEGKTGAVKATHMAADQMAVIICA